MANNGILKPISKTILFVILVILLVSFTKRYLHLRLQSKLQIEFRKTMLILESLPKKQNEKERWTKFCGFIQTMHGNIENDEEKYNIEWHTDLPSYLNKYSMEETEIAIQLILKHYAENRLKAANYIAKYRWMFDE